MHYICKFNSFEVFLVVLMMLLHQFMFSLSTVESLILYKNKQFVKYQNKTTCPVFWKGSNYNCLKDRKELAKLHTFFILSLVLHILFFYSISLVNLNRPFDPINYLSSYQFHCGVLLFLFCQLCMSAFMNR